MKNYILIVVIFFSLTNYLTAQQMFTDQSDLLENNTVVSGLSIGVCDMDQDGLDDIIRLDGRRELSIQYQLENGEFEEFFFGDLGGGSIEFALIMADIDENGYLDIMSGGPYNKLKILMFFGRGTAELSNLDGPSIFLQNANFVDIDNNGTIDLFACHDEGISSIYSNVDGNLEHDTLLLDPVSTIPSDNSGNYGSIWTDYDNDGDLDLYISKCRFMVEDELDGRRVNLLFRNDGELGFTEVAESANLLPYAQTWATGFEDIDNDGDLDAFALNHDKLSVLYRNNGDGTFTDITLESGLTADLENFGYSFQVIMQDFNNDTYVDIFVTTNVDSTFFFINNGDNTFSRNKNAFSEDNQIGFESAAVGDLNNDGFIDLIGTLGFIDGKDSLQTDRLLLNNGNDNHWLKINLKGTTSNVNGIGARLELYGSWGKQIREVRTGESYGTMNSLTTFFGLGESQEIDSLVVKWPSGRVQKITNPEIDQTLLVEEGVITAINDHVVLENVKLFPNPVQEVLTISLDEVSGFNSLAIYSNEGRLIKSVLVKSSTELKLNIGDLKEGNYYIELNTNEGIKHLSFIKI